MIERFPSNPFGQPLSRRQLLAGSVAVAVGTAGCTDNIFGDGGEDTESVALEGIVPAEGELLAELDVSTLEADEHDQLLEELDEIESGTIDVGGTLAGLEAKAGIDPLEADRVVLFGDESGDVSENDSPTGESASVTVLLEGNWNTDDVIDTIETRKDGEYEATDFDGNLYESVDGAESTELPAIGIAGDSQFVLGDEADVRDSLEVRYGDAEPVSGRLLEAHEEQDAQFTVVTEAAGELDLDEIDAFDVPIPGSLDIFEEVVVVSRAYDVVDDGMHLEAGLYTDSESDATELEEVLRGTIAALRSTSGEELSGALEVVEIERTETVVRIRYEGDEDAVIDLIEEV